MPASPDLLQRTFVPVGWSKKYNSLEIISDVLFSLPFIRRETSEEGCIKILLYERFQKLH